MRDPSARLCPECGEPATTRWPVAVGLWPKRRMLPALVTLLAAAALGAWLWRTSAVVGPVTSAAPSPHLIQPPVTPDDLAAIARGDGAAGTALVRSVLHGSRHAALQPGITVVTVGWVPMPHTVVMESRRGWPFAWHERSEMRWYEDSASRSGFKPRRTDRTRRPLALHESPPSARLVPPRERFGWSGAKLYHHPPPEATEGVVVTESWDVFAALWPLAAGIAVWAPGRLGLLVVRLIRKRVEPRLARRLVALAAAATAVLASLTLLTHVDREESIHLDWAPTVQHNNAQPPQVFWTLRDFVQLPATRTDLIEFADDSAGDAKLARMILAAEPPAPNEHQSGELLLAAAPLPEAIFANASYISISPPLRLMSIMSCQYLRRADFGEPEPLPEGIRIFSAAYFERFIGVQWGSGPTRSDITRVSLTIDTSLAVIVALWSVWLLARLAATGALAITARRRRRRSQCVACGYG